MRRPRNHILIKGWILILLFILIHPRTSAQSSPMHFDSNSVLFEHIGPEHGVNSYSGWMFEDQLGFLWFGAGPEGMYRYDGYEFKHYEFFPGDTTSLPHNIVADLKFEDHLGNLWLLSGGMMTRYNRATDDFTRFSNGIDAVGLDTWGRILFMAEDKGGNTWLGSMGNPSNPQSGGLIGLENGTDKLTLFQHDPADSASLSDNGITALFKDSRGDLWIGTLRGGVDRYVAANGKEPAHFIHYRKRMNDPGDSMRTAILHFTEDPAGALWVGTGNGVLRFDRENELFIRYRLHPDPGHPSNKTSCFPENPRGNLWVGTRMGVAVYDPFTDGFTFQVHDPDDLHSITPGTVNKIIHGKDGSTWIITDDGSGARDISRFNPISGHFEVYSHHNSDRNGLSQHNITDLLVDRNGIVWITTAGGGINKYDPFRRKFRTLSEIKLEVPGEWPQGVLSLCLDHRNRLWIGTNGKGLYSYDRLSGETIHYPYFPGEPESGPRSVRIWDVVEQPEGILWIGGDSGLNKLDTRTMEFEHHWVDPDWEHYFGSNYIRQISARKPGTIWIATMGGGLFSFDVTTGRFQSHLKSETNPGGVPPDGLMSVYEDHMGRVWVGSLGGLHGYAPANWDQPATCAHYWHLPKENNSIGSNMVGDMLMDRHGILWAATGGGGLNKIDPVTGRVTRYTSKQGLLSNNITTIAIDRQDQLWIGSYSGLGRFDPETGQCITYDRSDGLPSMEVTQGSTFQSTEGEIFLAGPGGIFHFHPDSIPYNDYIPPVVLTRTELFGQPLAIDPEGQLELKHNENFLSFQFASLNYSNSQKNQYRYCMIGLDPDTVFAGTRRTASYTDIKPGKYTFWVTGSNNDGVWNPAGTSLDITIHPPWSKSNLAIGLYVILFFAGIMGLIRWRTWKLLNDRKILEKQVRERTRVIEEKDRHILEMDRMKTRFFANVSHEFRTPLTLILSPLEEIISRRKAGDPELKKLRVIRRNGQRLMGLVNQLLDLSKLDSGKLKLELEQADVIRNLRLICSSFISLAEKNRIRYSIHLPEREYVTYFDAGKLETILNNLLSNAFKYTPREGIIECYGRIEENGQGEGSGNDSGRANGPVQLSISVIDSGPGIAPEKHQHIFDRFYQGDEQYQIEGGGTGIGLSLTKELVELIHGDISVNSEPGEGSCFVVKIPLGRDSLNESEYVIKEKGMEEALVSFSTVESDPAWEDGEVGENNHLPPREHIHLLIVEDNDDLRLYLKEQLQNLYTIVEASAGDKGLKQALKLIPDLIITDVMMPGMDGIELCKRLKYNERTSHIPVIMLTAKADFDSRITGLETGADDYILKPFKIKELRTRVHNLIQQRNMLRERFSGNMDKIAADISLNSYDVKFIRRVTEVVEDHLSDFEFDVRKLQEKSGMSHTQLYRKLHALTGYSPSRFIRHLRLKRAEKLLEQHKGSVTHVAYEVGFGNLSYFTKCFKEEFGISPSAYSRQYE